MEAILFQAGKAFAFKLINTLKTKGKEYAVTGVEENCRQ